MALNKNAKPETNEKNNATAFVNWSLPLSSGKSLKSNKGFPIFQNPKYPNKAEDKLVELAKKHGGVATVMMECRIMINNGSGIDDIDVDDIVTIPTGDATDTDPALIQ